MVVDTMFNINEKGAREMQPLDNNHDIHYSPDDDMSTGLGWYVQQFPGGRTSQSFETETEARIAFKNDKLVFNS